MGTRTVAARAALAAAGLGAFGVIGFALASGKTGLWGDVTSVADGTRLVAPELTVASRDGAPNCVMAEGATVEKVSGSHGTAKLLVVAIGADGGPSSCPVGSTATLESHYPVEELSPVRGWRRAP